MKNLIIGIDPDCEKSGLCVIDKDEKKVIKAEALPFPELITTVVLHSFLGEIKCVG
jgi:Holliday junction resolvasome RuvABC endonuclease subunit